MFSSHPASCFCRLEKHPNNDSQLLCAYYKPARCSINDFKPHHNPVRSISQTTLYRKGNWDPINIRTLLWPQQSKDSDPEVSDSKAPILVATWSLLPTMVNNEMITMPFCVWKERVDFSRHLPTQSQSSGFIHSVSSWPFPFTKAFFGFKDTGAARRGRVKRLEEEFGVRLRSVEQLAENKRKWDFKVLELKFIGHLPCARQCSKHLSCISLHLNPPNRPVW